MEVKAQSESIIEAVKKAIDDKAWSSGQMTSDKFVEIMDNFKKDFMQEQQQKMESLEKKVDALSAGSTAPSTSQAERTTSTARGGCIYSYSGRFFSVPQDFQFPAKVSLKSGINFWFRGLSIGDEGNFVKPFRELTVKGLPTKKLKDDFKLQWLGCFKNLESSGISLPRVGTNVSQEEVDKLYSEFTAVLKQRFSYCFTKTEDCVTTWSISTWAKKMTRSQVLKDGSDSDKRYLAPATYKNNSNNRNKSRKRKNKENPLYLNRQEKRQNRNNNNNNT